MCLVNQNEETLESVNQQKAVQRELEKKGRMVDLEAHDWVSPGLEHLVQKKFWTLCF